MCISLVRQTGLPIHVISVAHCCPLVLIEDITLMSQDACHIWNYYIIKCYKMLVIFTNYDRHYVIFTNMRQYCYSPGWWLPTFAIIPPADDCLLLLLFPWLMTAYFCYYSPGWWLPTFAIIPRLMTAYFCYYSPDWWLPTFAIIPPADDCLLLHYLLWTKEITDSAFSCGLGYRFNPSTSC